MLYVLHIGLYVTCYRMYGTSPKSKQVLLKVVYRAVLEGIGEVFSSVECVCVRWLSVSKKQELCSTSTCYRKGHRRVSEMSSFPVYSAPFFKSFEELHVVF